MLTLRSRVVPWKRTVLDIQIASRLGDYAPVYSTRRLRFIFAETITQTLQVFEATQKPGSRSLKTPEMHFLHEYIGARLNNAVVTAWPTSILRLAASIELKPLVWNQPIIL
jgi:hypothetical protein